MYARAGRTLVAGKDPTMSRWLALIAASLPLPAFAGVVCGSSFPIPAIDDVGLIVLAALVAGVAGWAAKRRK
jgi:hypothetical protein